MAFLDQLFGGLAETGQRLVAEQMIARPSSPDSSAARAMIRAISPSRAWTAGLPGLAAMVLRLTCASLASRVSGSRNRSAMRRGAIMS